MQFQKKIIELKNLGVKKIFFAAGGIGDGVMFAGAMKNLRKNAGETQFITHKHKILFDNNLDVKFVDFGFYLNVFDDRTEKLALKLKENGIDLIFLDYLSKVTINTNIYFGYGEKHIIAEMCEKAGIVGKIQVKPEIYLTDEEKKFGRFFEKNQIAVISEATSRHKNYENIQELISKLKGKYNFVQIGLKSDKMLEGVLDKRGVLNLREIAATIYNSDIFVGLLGGMMHLARAVDTRSVIAFTGVEPLNFVSYPANVNVLPHAGCDLCIKNVVGPLDPCPKNYVCAKIIPLQKMIDGIELQMSKLGQKMEVEQIELKDKPKSEAFNPIAILSNVNKKTRNFLFDKILFLLIKNNRNIKKKYYLFGFLGILKIEKYNNFQDLRVYLFNFIPILKIMNFFEAKKTVFLFDKIPFLKFD